MSQSVLSDNGKLRICRTSIVNSWCVALTLKIKGSWFAMSFNFSAHLSDYINNCQSSFSSSWENIPKASRLSEQSSFLFWFVLSPNKYQLLVTGNGNWWKQAVFGLVKRTAGAKSLSLLCIDLVCSVQCAKALVGTACMSGGNTEVLPAPADSLRDHSISELDLKLSFP